MELVKGNIMDVDLFIFGIKDGFCKRINVGITKTVVFEFDINPCEERGVVAVRKNSAVS